MRGTQAVRSGVTAADDDHPPAGRGDRRLGEVTQLHPVRGDQVLHGEVDAVELPTGHRQVPADRRTAGEHDRVIGRTQFVRGDVDADVARRREHRPLGPHLRKPTVQDALFHLELGDAVAQQTTDTVGPLVHDDVVTGAGELLGRGEPCRARADHRHPLVGPHGRQDRPDRAVVPRPVNDRNLDLLDGHRVVPDAQHAGGLAGRRAQPSGELGEVVGGVQPFDGLAPVGTPHQIVPLGDDVSERAAVVAEGDAAVHAPGCLVTQRPDRERLVDLFPVGDAHVDGSAHRQLPVVPEEACRVSHYAPVG